MAYSTKFKIRYERTKSDFYVCIKISRVGDSAIALWEQKLLCVSIYYSNLIVEAAREQLKKTTWMKGFNRFVA